MNFSKDLRSAGKRHIFHHSEDWILIQFIHIYFIFNQLISIVTLSKWLIVFKVQCVFLIYNDSRYSINILMYSKWTKIHPILILILIIITLCLNCHSIFMYSSHIYSFILITIQLIFNNRSTHIILSYSKSVFIYLLFINNNSNYPILVYL